MFLSANGGLTAFFPRDIVDDPTIPPVAITDFKIFGKDSPLKSKLSHSENVLTFGFAALSYASPERNRYRYRLEPLETQWNKSHGDRLTAEALRNAFRHARARRIEVEIRYHARKLRVRVRDDGIGIDAKVIGEGRTGHWGLPGMRERAKATGDNTSHDTFNGMADVAVAKNGDVFIADGEGPNTRVAKFSGDGKFIKWWGGKGTGPGQFDVPHSIAIDSKGRVYVADRSSNRIQIFDENGKFLNQWTNFGTPWGLFIKDDLIYVVDGTENNRLLIAGIEDGKVRETIGGLSNATAVTVDSRGAIYVGEVNGTNVKKFVR